VLGAAVVVVVVVMSATVVVVVAEVAVVSSTARSLSLLHPAMSNTTVRRAIRRLG